MATWQHVIELIPKSWWINNKEANLKIDDDFYDIEICWENNQPTIDVASEFDKILNRTKSWTDKILIWGDNDGNDISVGYENNKIDSIRIRLDLRDNNAELLEKIIAFSEANDFLFYLPESNDVIEPQMVVEHVKNSDAMRFVKDPRKFLDSLKADK